MAANRTRGEVAFEHEGESYSLCLTLAALAEIEAGLGLSSLDDLFHRLAGGHITSADVRVILAAALKGGGHTGREALVARLGLAEALGLVAMLLEASFAPLLGHDDA